MTSPLTGLTVERLADLLRRSRLLSPDAVRAVEGRWHEGADDPADVARFARWLVGQGHVTEYQLALLVHGHVDHCFLGPYKLLDRVGKGALAVVYRAVREGGQTVALKVLAPSRARDPRLLARFQNEARLACQLDHPNVVRAVEAGEAGGVHFLVLEYLRGENLADLLRRRGPLPPQEVLHVARQTLAGLRYLFERGLVHRNLEPANLMLAYPPDVDGARAGIMAATVKILDTSLSRSLFAESAEAAAPRLTHEGELLGTPEYLAPEQARDARAADIRADLYSLGCILYHALTGAPPFHGPSPLGLVIRHATEPPRPLRAVRPGVPAGLEAAVDRLLAKDPDRRFPTPAAALDALTEKPAPPAPPPAREPTPPPSAPAAESDLAQLPVVSPLVNRPAAPPPARVNVGLYLFLGALGLLAAELVGWFLAYLLHVQSLDGRG